MRVVGLTGGIACGKSTASQQFIDLGVPLIDCDKISHNATRKGAWGYRRIVKAFGRDILTNDGDINRPLLGRLVFTDAAARRRLNQATHLPVAAGILKQLLAHWLRCEPLVVVDMPLLFETGVYKYVNDVVLVACSAQLQLQRLMHRDGSTQADAQARIDSQGPLARKMELAHVVLVNDGSFEQLQQQVRNLVHTLKKKSVGWRHWLTSPVVAAGTVVVALHATTGL